MTSSEFVQAADKLMKPAVLATLAALELEDEDAAAAKLAERFASELDQASAVSATADRVLRQVKFTDDASLIEQVEALKKKLSAHVIVATIGPKLHDLLTSLGATPKSRAQLGKGGQASGHSSLDELRQRRQAG